MVAPQRHTTGGFNPRPREGGDPQWMIASTNGKVSIHAPARGATCPHYRTCTRSRFNPRPREGGDCVTSGANRCGSCFNPRPREGGDLRPPIRLSGRQVSIHAPARGATRNPGKERLTACFNPRPREGGDSWCTGAIRAPKRFNPRPREGGDGIPSSTPILTTVSIHAPARGATARFAMPTCRLVFQSTPPRGGRQRTALT